jgi:hypothetical protein
VKVPVHRVEADTNKNGGLCARVYASFRYFLEETNAHWYFRAIDDTWIHPGNMVELMDQLEGFSDPTTALVMKASKTRQEDFNCTS